MLKLPKIKVIGAETKHHTEISGVVTVGAASAAKLTKQLGRKVEVGETFDLGTIAMVDPNPFKTWWGNIKIAIKQRNSPFAQ